jgi:hypothetical protein
MERNPGPKHKRPANPAEPHQIQWCGIGAAGHLSTIRKFNPKLNLGLADTARFASAPRQQSKTSPFLFPNVIDENELPLLSLHALGLPRR